ncbi:hypothetical protein VP150E351_P0223 [Vibrio phage 150E35-1]|nr:hypothetical protein VP150E351_P0223 [Vibrio phage 150E35-1]
MNVKITVIQEVARVLANSTLVDTCLDTYTELDRGTLVFSIPSVEHGIVIVSYDGLVGVRFGVKGDYVVGMNRTIWDISSFDQLVSGMIEHEQYLRSVQG